MLFSFVASRVCMHIKNIMMAKDLNVPMRKIRNLSVLQWRCFTIFSNRQMQNRRLFHDVSTGYISRHSKESFIHRSEMNSTILCASSSARRETSEGDGAVFDGEEEWGEVAYQVHCLYFIYVCLKIAFKKLYGLFLLRTGPKIEQQGSECDYFGTGFRLFELVGRWAD